MEWKSSKRYQKELTTLYGKGFDYSSLYKFVRFYKAFPNILDSLSTESSALLSWTHYRTLLQVEDKRARDWYEREAFEQAWGVRTLQRNISSQYYYRMLQTRKDRLITRAFLMELGKGYAFVARQQHIHTEKQDYYIDLI